MTELIAVTGGPSGGKTTLVQILEKEFFQELSLIPESASLLYRGGFPRPKSPIGRRHVQRAICFVQRELEDWARAESGKAMAVCDRGSLDSIAYWPGDENDFFQSLGSDRGTELARYTWVIHLDTAHQMDFDSSNPIRTESFDEALILNEKIKFAWRGHPQRIIIPHSHEFLEKMGKARRAIELILAGKSYDRVLQGTFPETMDNSG